VARAAAFIDHVTIEVADYEASRAFYQRALAPLGVTHNEVTSPDSGLPEAVFGPPGVGARYHPSYYGAFVLDPDGNNVEAVCHEGPE
jgi:catechol 2,3-dioxygenase-like lactoylglutathione lyase family enzyme